MPPVILVQLPVPACDDCHWKVRPPATVVPVSESVNTVLTLPVVGDIAAVPAVGVEEHAPAPVPVTAMF